MTPLISICISIFFDIFTLGYIRTTFSPKSFEANTYLLLKGFLKWWHIWACGRVSALFLVRRISCIIMNLYYKKMVRSSWYRMFFFQLKCAALVWLWTKCFTSFYIRVVCLLLLSSQFWNSCQRDIKKVIIHLFLILWGVRSMLLECLLCMFYMHISIGLC